MSPSSADLRRLTRLKAEQERRLKMMQVRVERLAAHERRVWKDVACTQRMSLQAQEAQLRRQAQNAERSQLEQELLAHEQALRGRAQEIRCRRLQAKDGPKQEKIYENRAMAQRVRQDSQRLMTVLQEVREKNLQSKRMQVEVQRQQRRQQRLQRELEQSHREQSRQHCNVHRYIDLQEEFEAVESAMSVVEEQELKAVQRLQNSQNARADAMALLQSSRGECGMDCSEYPWDDMYEKENENLNLHGNSNAKSAVPLFGALTPTRPGPLSPRHLGGPPLQPSSSQRSPLPRSGIGAPNSPGSRSRALSGYSSCPKLAWEPSGTSLGQITEEEDVGSNEHSSAHQAGEEFRQELASAQSHYINSSQEFTKEQEKVQSYPFFSQASASVQSPRQRTETVSKPGCSGREHPGVDSGPPVLSHKLGSRTSPPPGPPMLNHTNGSRTPSLPTSTSSQPRGVLSPRSNHGGRALALSAAGPMLVRSVPSEGCCVLGGVPARGAATCTA